MNKFCLLLIFLFLIGPDFGECKCKINETLDVVGEVLVTQDNDGEVHRTQDNGGEIEVKNRRRNRKCNCNSSFNNEILMDSILVVARDLLNSVNQLINERKDQIVTLKLPTSNQTDCPSGFYFNKQACQENGRALNCHTCYTLHRCDKYCEAAAFCRKQGGVLGDDNDMDNAIEDLRAQFDSANTGVHYYQHRGNTRPSLSRVRILGIAADLVHCTKIKYGASGTIERHDLNVCEFPAQFVCFYK